MIVVALLAIVAAVALFVRAASWRAWPPRTPRPFRCAICDLDYSDPRALAWHQAGQHPFTYDEERARRA